MLADVVEIELRDVGDEVARDPGGGLLERQVRRIAIGLRMRVLGRRIVGMLRAGSDCHAEHALDAYAGGR